MLRYVLGNQCPTARLSEMSTVPTYFINYGMIPMFFIVLVAILFTVIPSVVFAVGSGGGLTDVFNSLVGVGMTVHDLIQAICIVTGAGLLLGAFIQYKKYRQNPIETKLSTVFVNLLVGIALIILAFIPPQFVGGK
jgi:hypothetical protein